MTVYSPKFGTLSLSDEDYYRVYGETALLRKLSAENAGVSSASSTPAAANAGGQANEKAKKVEVWEAVPQQYYYEPQGNRAHKYFFELVIGNREKVLDVVKCPYVTNLSGDPSPATVLSYTTTTLYEEHEGYRQRTFTISGKSGFTPADIDNFKRFRNFFEKVQQLKAENLNAFIRGSDVRLVLNFPFEGESYFCNVVKGLTYVRDRSSMTYSYVWSLTVQTSGYVARKWTVPLSLKKFLDTECTPDNDSCHVGRRHPCRMFAEISASELPVEADPLKDLTEIIVEDCDRLLELEGTSQSLRHFTYEELHRKCMIGIQSTTYWYKKLDVAAADAYLDWFIAIVGWVTNVAMECRMWRGSFGQRFIDVAINSSLASYIFDAVDRLKSLANILAEGLKPIRLVTDDVYTVPAVRSTDLVEAAPEIRGQSPTVSVEIQPHDTTVYELGYRLFGTASAGDIIYRLNPDLADARTWVGGRPLSPGDKLLVPATVGVANVSGPPLGIDWKVVDYDFVWDPIKNDFVRVTGIDCYVQNMSHRLLTEYGENRAFRETGMKPAEHLDSEDASLRASEVQVQVLMDPRTASIKSLDFGVDDESIYVDVSVNVVSGETAGITYRG